MKSPQVLKINRFIKKKFRKSVNFRPYLALHFRSYRICTWVRSPRSGRRIPIVGIVARIWWLLLRTKRKIDSLLLTSLHHSEKLIEAGISIEKK